MNFCKEKIYYCHRIVLLVSSSPLLQLSCLIMITIVFQFGLEGRSCKTANQIPGFNFVLLQSEGFMTVKINFFWGSWKWIKFFESLKKVHKFQKSRILSLCSLTSNYYRQCNWCICWDFSYSSKALISSIQWSTGSFYFKLESFTKEKCQHLEEN